MATIDIRNTSEDAIDTITFASASSVSYICGKLVKGGNDVEVQDPEDDYRSLVIESKEDAENMIKALQKAIELGWFK